MVETGIPEEIRGVLQEIVYRSEDSGYTVAEFACDGMNLTAVGLMPLMTEGVTYMLKGEFVSHDVYGEQFSVTCVSEDMPRGIYETEMFLASGAIKGVGPVMARQIVARFGEDTMDIIENSPSRLQEVPGIGPKKVAAISEMYRNRREYAEALMFLQQFGIKPAAALKIYNIFGKDTVTKVRENPYLLAGEAGGIGFPKADAIAMKMGIEKDNAGRIAGGIIHRLRSYAASGHMFAGRKELAEETAEMLDVSVEEVDDMIIQTSFDGKTAVDMLEGRQVVYLYGYWKAEKSVTGNLVALCQGDLKALSLDTDNMIRQTESQTGVEFSEEQKKAVRNCINNGVSVITGGPGTGKTTIINGIINILLSAGINVSLCAPTGRAARRLSETTGCEASTVHRLLEYHIDQDSGMMIFGRNRDKPLKTDAVIVDEASMLDILLAEALLDAMKPGMRLILVGDVDQLPSVGAGNVLRDIIDSEYIYCERLTEIFRQARESMIVVNAHRINRGESPYANEKDKDFFFMTRHREKDVLNLIVELCVKRLPAYFGFKDRTRDIQVLAPSKKGILGTENLNRELQSALNPPASGTVEKKTGNRILREGDKVMQIKNDYELEWTCAETMEKGEGVFNGDVGFIRRINRDEETVTVVFDGERYVTYDFGQLDELELAYAMTVHKSQGSEFPAVIIPMSWVPRALSGRNLLYTGVTRGKEAVVLVGEKRFMNAMIENNSVIKRNSGLAVRIKEFL